EELSETNYISFIRKDSSKIAIKEKAKIDLSGIQMNFDLEVTPSTEAQIIFDKKVGDVIKVKGNGNLKFEINTLGNFNMYGDYTIEEGDYLFTLKNLINKRFKIEKGGTIKWNGSPYDANVNMNAIYTARTSIADLVIGGDTGKYKQIVPVQCILTLKEKLLKPAISFDIKIPDADENIQRSLKNITSSEQETNNQVFYLLLANRFKPIGNQNNMFNSGIGGLGTTSTELLSNQLNNWLSQISTDFNIGVNYRTGDKLNPTQLEVALSTQLFNNRVLIDGNVGIGNQKTSNLVGDFTVEYKLTQEGKFRVKAFNKTNNNNEYLNINANQYTQGLGISYRKEFDSLGDFFRKIKKNK
ncbi:MAG: translocation/assembly module TamB domain-containing protein, partial [Bacteroidota bacterium]|nr:translocation/assembly module TamB domain-containing protein [Bacteroidota bacterium]